MTVLTTPISAKLTALRMTLTRFCKTGAARDRRPAGWGRSVMGLGLPRLTGATEAKGVAGARAGCPGEGVALACAGLQESPDDLA